MISEEWNNQTNLKSVHLLKENHDRACITWLVELVARLLNALRTSRYGVMAWGSLLRLKRIIERLKFLSSFIFCE
jgi:hypothetical protein